MAGIANPFFSERYIAFMPLDKQKLYAEGGWRVSQPANPFFSERHIALIPLDKTKLYAPTGISNRSFLSDASLILPNKKALSFRWMTKFANPLL